MKKKLLHSFFFSTHKVGDTLTYATHAQLLEQLESIDANGNDNMQKTATEKFVNSLMILITLEDNELLKVDGETTEYTLTGVKKPGKLLVMYAYGDLGVALRQKISTGGPAHHQPHQSVIDNQLCGHHRG